MISKGLTSQVDGPLVSDFGNLVAQLREERQMNQVDLAKELRKSTSFVSLLEGGKRKPARELVEQIGEVLKLSSDEQRNLLNAAGFAGDGTNRAIDELIDSIRGQQAIAHTHQMLIKEDLKLVVTSWLEFLEGREKLRGADFKKASDSFEEMIKHTEYSPMLAVQVRLDKADVALQMGDLGRAKNALQEATRAMEGWPDEWWAFAFQAEVLATRGMLALREGLYELAGDFLNESKARYLKLLSLGPEHEEIAIQGLARSYKRFAQLALFQGEPVEALVQCTNAESNFLQLHRDPMLTAPWLRRTKELKAWAYSQLGQFQKAIELHKEALKECHDAKDTYGVIKNHLYLGDDYRRHLDTLIGAEGGYESFEAERRQEIIRNVFQDEERRAWLNKAEEYYTLAYQGCLERKEQLLQGRCLHGLGVIFRLKGALEGSEHYDAARQKLEQALALEREIGQGRRLPGIYEAMAKLAWDQAWDQREFAHVLRYYKLALEKLNSPLVSSSDTASERLRQRVLKQIQMLENHLESAATARIEITAISDQTITYSGQDGSQAWRLACQGLIREVIQAVRNEGAFHVQSDLDKRWLGEMWKMEIDKKLQGPRFLAQNRLSASLSLLLPAGFPAEGATLHQRRYDAFHHRVQSANDLSGKDRYHDLCCRETVERGVKNKDTRSLFQEQVKNARALMTEYPHGYWLDTTLYELPLAFAVKGKRTLIEIPRKLANQLIAEDRGPEDLGTHLCYRFDDEELARRLREVFGKLLEAARESTKRQALTEAWLGKLAIQKPALAGVM